MRKLLFTLIRIVMLIAILGTLSFTINMDSKIEEIKNDVSDVVISEWFPHEFNLNPTSATSFKISYDSNKTLNDHTILVFGRNILGTSVLPYNNSIQDYAYQLSENHIEFKAQNIGNNDKATFDFFTEFRYMIIPNTEIATMTVAVEHMNYQEIAEYLTIRD